MSDIILFDHPLSPYAQKVKIALYEKNIPFETKIPSNIGSGSANELTSANPRGEVPTLVHDGFAIYDSSIILEYIEENWPAPALLPSAPKERARVRMIEEFMDTHYEAINWGLSEIHFFGRAEGELADTLLTNASQQIQDWFNRLETELSDRQWFNGESFGWADLCVIPYINGSAGFDIKPPKDSTLANWVERVNARESVQKVNGQLLKMNQGQDRSNIMAMVKQAVDQGLFKREYRDHRLEWMIKSGGVSVVLKGLEKNNIRFTPVFPAKE